jgi:hypothetical protein
MAGEKDFQRRLEIIERGIRDLEATADAGMRASVQQLVQSIVELHGRSLARLLEIVDAAGVAGPAIIDQLGRDPLVRPLLLLHSLHPLAFEARILRALEGVRPSLEAAHASVELLGVDAGVVRVRVTGRSEQQAAVERVIVDAAPDLAALEVERIDAAIVGFVSIDSLRHADPLHGSSAPSPLALRPGA